MANAEVCGHCNEEFDDTPASERGVCSRCNEVVHLECEEVIVFKYAIHACDHEDPGDYHGGEEDDDIAFSREWKQHPYLKVMRDYDRAGLRGDWAAEAAAVKSALDLLPDYLRVVGTSKKRLMFSPFQCIGNGGRLLAALGERDALTTMQEIVNSHLALIDYANSMNLHWRDLEWCATITKAIAAEPGIPQQDIKHVLRINDGRVVAPLIHMLEEIDRIVRVPHKRTYQLYLAGEEPQPTP